MNTLTIALSDEQKTVMKAEELIDKLCSRPDLSEDEKSNIRFYERFLARAILASPRLLKQLEELESPLAHP